MASLKDFLPTSATLYRDGHMTELFYSHGSIGALAVGENSGSGSGNLEISLQKSYTDCREPRFASTCPTLPLCSPNKGTNNSLFFQFSLYLSISITIGIGPSVAFLYIIGIGAGIGIGIGIGKCVDTPLLRPSLTLRPRSNWLI